MIANYDYNVLAMDLDNRQIHIFEIAVEEFIKSARPVGSEFLVENYDLKISPATVRNDLAFLEGCGLLAKPHTSGGRIPTSEGWRYFIGEVWQSDLPKEEIIKLNNLTSELLGKSEEIMECISKIFPDVSDEFFKKFLVNKLFNDHERRK